MVGQTNLIYALLRIGNKVTFLHDMNFYVAEETLTKLKLAKEAAKEEKSQPNSARSSISSPSSAAKGKQNLAPSDASTAPKYDSNGKFIPTEAWYNFWKSQLPLAVMVIIIESLGPTIERLCIDQEVTDDQVIIKHLENATLVGILPAPHAIFVRKIHVTEGTRIWFLSFFWGSCYIRYNMPGDVNGRLCPPIWNATNVRLFYLKVE